MGFSVSLQGLGLLVLGAVLLQTIAVSVSFMYFTRVVNTMQGSFSWSSASCLINNNLHAGFGDEHSHPCWQVMKQLHLHIEKATDDRFQEMTSQVRGELTDLRVTSPKVAAHVTGVSSSTVPPPAEGGVWQSSRGYLGERIRAWDGHRGMSFLQNVDLIDGELHVTTAGHYYVYAQTYFKLASSGEDGAQLVQYVYKKMSSYTAPLLLMKSSRTACWPQGPEPGLFSLHQAGTAFLEPADRIFVTVSNGSAVEMDGGASYFGAFLVG